MCSIFGTNIKDIDKLKKLSIAGMSRGKDATGIASIGETSTQLIKGDVKASKLDYSKINEGNFFLGHTRKTTQGNESDNYNNHPFTSQDNTLLLAHNGIISNDKELWTYKTEIETDSFTVMQQLEKEKGDNGLTIENVKTVCEKLRGSFTLTIIDVSTDTLFLLRHTNPLKIMYNSETGDLVYASETQMIRKGYGKESNFNTFIGETEENLIYEFDLKNKEFVNQKEFSPKKYKTTTTNYYNGWGTTKRLKRFFDKAKEKFNLSNLKHYHFDTKKEQRTYGISEYEQCEFCGIWYRNDDYVKAGVIKDGIHFCAYCWEGEQETSKKEHKITDEQLELAKLEKEQIQKQELIEGNEFPPAKITEKQFNKLSEDSKNKYIFCSSCKNYYFEDYNMVFYDNHSKTYKCSTCYTEETFSDTQEVS